MANVPTDITDFPLNSYVLQRYENDEHRPPHKLNTRLRGPHKVLSKRNDGEVDIYTVENLATNRLEDFKVHDLQPFTYDPAYCDPRAVAMQDQQMFAVEAIRRHRGHRARKAQMEFEVKWLGYPESDNTWEPWANLRDNRALHAYLQAQGMESLIPRKWIRPLEATGPRRPQAQAPAPNPTTMASATSDDPIHS